MCDSLEVLFLHITAGACEVRKVVGCWRKPTRGGEGNLNFWLSRLKMKPGELVNVGTPHTSKRSGGQYRRQLLMMSTTQLEADVQKVDG